MFADVQRLDDVLHYIVSYPEENGVVDGTFPDDMIRHVIALWRAAEARDQRDFIANVSAKLHYDGEQGLLRRPLQHLRGELRRLRNPAQQAPSSSSVSMDVVEPLAVQEGMAGLTANLRSLFTDPGHEFNRVSEFGDVATRVIAIELPELTEPNQILFMNLLQQYASAAGEYQARYQELLSTLINMGYQPSTMVAASGSQASAGMSVAPARRARVRREPGVPLTAQQQHARQELTQKIHTGYYVNGSLDAQGQATTGSYQTMVQKLVHDAELFNMPPFNQDASFMEALESVTQLADDVFVEPQLLSRASTHLENLNRYFISLQASMQYMPLGDVDDRTDKTRKNINDATMTDDIHNPHLVRKFQALNEEHDIAEIQGVRGDGNCYFRAVLKTHIESIILSDNREQRAQLFNYLANLVEGEVLRDGTYCRDHGTQESLIAAQTVVDKFRLAANAQAWTHLQDFWHDLAAGDEGSFDLALMSTFRYVMAEYLMKNQDMDCNGIPLSMSILSDHPVLNDPNHPDLTYFDLTSDQINAMMRDYCRTDITTMGRDAEGAFVYLAFLPTLIRCNLNAWLCTRLPVDDLQSFSTQFDADGDFNVPDNIKRRYGLSREFPSTEGSILFRPGHYDACILKSAQAVRLRNQENAPFRAFDFLDERTQNVEAVLPDVAILQEPLDRSHSVNSESGRQQKSINARASKHDRPKRKRKKAQITPTQKTISNHVPDVISQPQEFNTERLSGFMVHLHDGVQLEPIPIHVDLPPQSPPRSPMNVVDESIMSGAVESEPSLQRSSENVSEKSIVEPVQPPQSPRRSPVSVVEEPIVAEPIAPANLAAPTKPKSSISLDASTQNSAVKALVSDMRNKLNGLLMHGNPSLKPLLKRLMKYSDEFLQNKIVLHEYKARCYNDLDVYRHELSYTYPAEPSNSLWTYFTNMLRDFFHAIDTMISSVTGQKTMAETYNPVARVLANRDHFFAPPKGTPVGDSIREFRSSLDKLSNVIVSGTTFEPPTM